MADEIVYVALDRLVDNPKNFFRPLDDEALADLSDSIAKLGVLHPLVVRPVEGERCEIISGHQRKKAAAKAGLSEVPCRVMDVDECTAELMLIDANLETRAPTNMELARAIRRKKELLGVEGGGPPGGRLTMRRLAGEFNLSRAQAYRLDSLNDLIPELQGLVDRGKLGVVSGDRLARLSQDVQRALWQALGEEIASLTSDEAKRLRDESDRGYLVLGVLQKRVQELEAQLAPYKDQEQTRDLLKEEIARLKGHARQLEYDILDRQSALTRLEKRVQGNGFALLTIMEELGRQAHSRKPEIQSCIFEKPGLEAVDKATLTHIHRWARAVKEIGAEVEAACSRVLFHAVRDARGVENAESR